MHTCGRNRFMTSPYSFKLPNTLCVNDVQILIYSTLAYQIMNCEQSTLNILLIEDNKHDALAIQRALKQSGLHCQITHHARAETFLEVLSSSRLFDFAYDIIVSDHHLPGISGLDTFRELLASDIPVPLVLLTGNGDAALAVEALKAGVDDYVMKDHQGRYLQLLSTLLPQVVRRFRERLARQQAEQTIAQRERMMASLVDVQHQLLSLDSDADLAENYCEIVHRLASVSASNRIYIFENRRTANGVLCIQLQAEWRADGASPILRGRPSSHLLFHDVLPPWSEVILETGNVLSSTRPPARFLDASAQPDDAAASTSATLFVPLLVDGALHGFVGFEKYAPETTWEMAEVDMLRAVTAALSLWREQRLADDKLRTYAAELQKQNADLDEFAHMVAHDIKNPLSIVVSASSALAADDIQLSAAERRALHRQVHEYAIKTITIVDELLLLASTRRKPVRLQPVDMACVIDAAITSLEPVIQRTNTQITQPAIWPRAQGYAPWLEEVWVNYISNGIKYGGTPPQLTLGATRLDNGLIRFWIRDNGDGLSPDEQSQLFTPFTRLHARRADGSGLGLFIVSRIVERLGGTVGVESSGEPGQGSCFSFTLPAAEKP